MKNKFTIGKREFIMLFINLYCVKLLFTFPKKMIVNSGNAAWIQVIYISIVMICLYYLIIKAYQICGSKNIIEIAENLGGNFIKIPIGLLIIIMLFFNLASIMRGYPDMVKLVLLPNTPTEFVLLIFALVIAIETYFGIESIIRIHFIFIPVIIAILSIFFVLLLPHVKLYNIFPIFGKGIKNIFTSGITSLDFFNDILVFNLLLPYSKNLKEAEDAGRKSIIISGGIAFIIVLMYCLIYPFPSSEKFIIPIYQIARLVGVGDFFQRFEAFFEFIWSFSVMLYSAVYLSVICMTIKQTFNLKRYKPIIFPITSAVTILSFEGKNINSILFNHYYLIIGMLIISFIIPIIFACLYQKKVNKRR